MAERFVSFVKRDDFDYTVWQREYFDEMEPVNLVKRHPLMPKTIFMREKRRFYNNKREKAVNRLVGLLLFTYMVHKFQTFQLDTDPTSFLST